VSTRTIRLTTVMRQRRHSGLTLVETMISLVITATLMTAVAAAYTASAKAIQINDQFFRATQAGRVCLNQLMSEIRQCSTVEVTSSTALSIVPATGTQAKVYTYDAANKQLLLTITDVSGTKNYVLGRNISALSFAGTSGNVAIGITVTVGNNAVSLAGSVTPRRMVAYH
jgi:Tfp pilus assembly protein PilW